jgi:photosystem II stability/assembly factor-like uncharacterized protein
MSEMTVLVGTIGHGIVRSPDGGESWHGVGVRHGLHFGAVVPVLACHPTEPRRVFAGTDRGLLRSDDAGQSWQRVTSPMDAAAVWSLAIDPTAPELMFAGTGTSGPARLFRSTDGGASWAACDVAVVDECPAIGVPRFTAIAARGGTVWATIEVDGVRVSRDAGETWVRLDDAVIRNPDVHNTVVLPGVPETVFIVVQNEVYLSRDAGETWTPVRAQETFPLGYCRGIAVKPGTQTVFVAIGDTYAGRTGGIVRSDDAGRSWVSLPLPVEPNSNMWAVNVQAADPRVVWAASQFGDLYRSDDSGDSWRKLWRELGEVSSLVWCPA